MMMQNKQMIRNQENQENVGRTRLETNKSRFDPPKTIVHSND